MPYIAKVSVLIAACLALALALALARVAEAEWRFKSDKDQAYLMIQLEDASVSMSFSCTVDSLFASVHGSSGPLTVGYMANGEGQVKAWAKELLNVVPTAKPGALIGHPEQPSHAWIHVPAEGFESAWKEFRAFCDAL